MPPKINKGGSQHQLDAMNADSRAPKLAKPSPRVEAVTCSLVGVSLVGVSLVGVSVAHGDLVGPTAQQSAAGIAAERASAGEESDDNTSSG
ncbi:MAG: hypothetical protein ACI9G1_000894 [Pirellulaceae bacterium]|jgi:hypothetical protein